MAGEPVRHPELRGRGGLAASAVGSAGWTIISGDLDKAAWAVGAGVWAALQWRLAGEVEHFSRWDGTAPWRS